MLSNHDTSKLIRDWVESIAMRSLREMSSYVRATGLSWPQFGVLMLLYHGGVCGVTRLGQRMEISGAGASQLIERLVQAGLVQRSENPDDRRARVIALSDKGCELVEQGISQRYQWLDKLVAGLDDERRQAVLAALPLLMDAEHSLLTGPPRT